MTALASEAGLRDWTRSWALGSHGGVQSFRKGPLVAVKREGAPGHAGEARRPRLCLLGLDPAPEGQQIGRKTPAPAEQQEPGDTSGRHPGAPPVWPWGGAELGNKPACSLGSSHEA